MKYLLITHVPAFAGQSPGVLRISEPWLHDLTAQTNALRGEGFDVTVATPVHAVLDAKTLAREHIVELPMAGQSFKHVALPGYRTMTQFLAQRRSLRKIAGAAAAAADIVQLGAGGHPVSLGQTLWEAVGKTKAKRLFVFADDPFPKLRSYAASGRNPAKRLAKSMTVGNLESFCARAVRDADLVFAHTPTIAQRFAKSWGPHCHTFGSIALADADLATELTGRAKRTSDNRRPLRIFCAGDVGAARGVDHLLRAVAKARRLSAKIELDLVGQMTGSAELMNLLRHERLEPGVRLHGPLSREKQLALMDLTDLAVAPGLLPGIDPIIFLAAARGMPIVTYQNSAAAAQAAGAGIVVPRGETNELAQVLLDLSRQRSRVVAMSEAALAWASTLTLDAVHRERAKLARACVKKRAKAV